MTRSLWLAAVLTLTLAGTVKAGTLPQPVTACQKQEDVTLQEAAGKEPGLLALKTSGACLTLPRGAAFMIERSTGALACIRVNGFDRCLWTAGLPQETW